jgi:hypothetical protein
LIFHPASFFRALDLLKEFLAQEAALAFIRGYETEKRIVYLIRFYSWDFSIIGNDPLFALLNIEFGKRFDY